MQRILTIGKNDWLKGVAPSSYSDLGGILSVGTGIDIWRSVGLLRAGLSLSDISGAVIADNPRSFIPFTHTDGVAYLYIYGDAGKIYRLAIAADTGLELIHTVASSAGEGAGLGVINSKIIYSCKTTLGTITSPAVANPTENDSGGGTGLTTSSFHPICIGADNWAYVGDEDGVARYDGTNAFGAGSSALDVFTIAAGFTVVQLANDGYYLVVGATQGAVSATSFKSKIYFWDMGPNTPNRVWDLEDILLQMIVKDGLVYIIGRRGFYVCDINNAPREIISVPTDVLEFGSNYYNNMTVHGGKIAWGTDGEVFEYGSPDIRFNKVFNIPVTGAGSTTGIFSVRVGTLVKLYIGGTTSKLYVAKTSSITGAIATTVPINLGRQWKIEGLKVYTEPLASGDTLTITVIGDQGTNLINSQTFSFTGDGAKSSKFINALNSAVSNITEEVKVELTFTAGAVKVKRLELYGTPERDYSTEA